MSNPGRTRAASRCRCCLRWSAPARPRRSRRHRRRPDRALLAVVGMALAFAAVFSLLSVLRYRTFSTGRFDLGNMVQAVWSTTQGRFLDTTDVSGVQFNRLGAHVDPVLALFAPLWWVWSSPEMLLVAQALIVATGALPAFWLGRRWLGDDRLAVAGAAVYLLYPALQSATLFDFHPVTLAAPLLMFCIWAAEEARYGVLAACATLAALTQEQVGLMLVGLAVWMAWRHPSRRRAALVLAAGGLAWVMIALTVIMPAFAIDGSNPHLSRYHSLGDSPLDIAFTLVTRPWEAIAIVATPGRVGLPGGAARAVAPAAPGRAAPRPRRRAPAPHQPLRQLRPRPDRGVPLRHRAGAVPRRGDAAGPGEPADERAGAAAGALDPAPPAGGGHPRRGGAGGGDVPGAPAALGLAARGIRRERPPPLPRRRPGPRAARGGGPHPRRRPGLGGQRRRLAPLGPAADPAVPEDRELATTCCCADNERFRDMARDRPTLRPPGYRFAALRLAESSRWETIYDREGVTLYRRLPREPRSS